MSIEVITKAEIIASAPDKWFETYSKEPWNEDERKQSITRRLQALKGTEFTAEQINEIIGNATWTELRCDECGNDSEVVVQFGDDYRAHDVCRDCLAKADAAAKRAERRKRAA